MANQLAVQAQDAIRTLTLQGWKIRQRILQNLQNEVAPPEEVQLDFGAGPMLVGADGGTADFIRQPGGEAPRMSQMRTD